MKNFNIKTKRKSGFTLLEALVAVSILMVAVAAPMTIAQKGLSSATYTKNQMIANYLAQDALEYVKNKRDEKALSSKNSALGNYDWGGLDIFSECMKDNNGCRINTLNNDINDAINTESDIPLRINDSGLYSYDDEGTETAFVRQIKITLGPYNNPDEALVAVTVKWGPGEEKVTVESLIYNY